MQFIKFHKDSGTKRAEIDVSGGVDSAVMLGLLSGVLGPENVTAVYQGIDSSKESLERAFEVARCFDVNLVEIDLSEMYEDLVGDMHDALRRAGFSSSEITDRISKDPTILGSIRSCLRAPIGRGFNRMTGGGIRHGTGNECEDRWLRFYQKGGDGEVDTNPLAMISKGEVLQLGVALGVPKSILSALPSPDLWGTGEGHNDEDELKEITGVDFTYSRVDPETGEYTQVGTIEEISRSLDRHITLNNVFINTLEHFLFSDDCSRDFLNELYSTHTNGQPDLYRAARKIEKSTRHKKNPNISTLGTREDLLNLKILTNHLPSLE